MASSPQSSNEGGAAGPLANFRWGLKGLRASIVSATAVVDPSSAEASTSASSSASANGEAPGGSGGSGSWAGWAGRARKLVADKAREVAYDMVPQKDANSPNQSDIERGEGQLGQLGKWVQATAKSVQQQVAQTATQVGERAKSLELAEQAKALQSEVSKGFGRVAEGASSAGAAISEKGKAAKEKLDAAKAIGAEKAKQAKALGVEKAKQAKEKAAAAAAGAKGALSQAGQSLSGLTALTLSPAKLAQFGGVFLVGMFLISMSFSFLPVFVVAPQKFALLFAFGSMAMLSSLAILKGPQSFLSAIKQKKQLPFTVSYIVGLVGTLVATIGLRSFLLTAVFGVIQAVALLYFLASFVPGGKALLNFCGRCCSKLARKVCGRLMRT